jgi:hypothetical protein
MPKPEIASEDWRQSCSILLKLSSKRLSGSLKIGTAKSMESLSPPIRTSLVLLGASRNIANSDAAYHDMNHTIMVTSVGQEILLGKHTSEGGVTPRDWLHFMISLLCHDIGYVRGVCRGDRNGHYICNEDGDLVPISAVATDASLTPYHVTRSKLFVRERFGKSLTHIVREKLRQTSNTRGFRYRRSSSIPARQIIRACFVPRCVYRQLKRGRSGDEVRPGWRVN